jgi:hypothetical protein
MLFPKRLAFNDFCCLPVRLLSVAGGFVDELGAGAEPEFGVDVGEVGLYRARGDEQRGGDVLVGQQVADESDDVAFGGGQRGPAAGGALRSPRPRWA